jgi:Mn2+/Fe2+ NRAMP family transporter
VLHICTIKALVWSAVLNAIASVPIMISLVRMGSNVAVIGTFTITPHSRLIGWLATTVMGAASLGFIVSLIHSP